MTTRKLAALIIKIISVFLFIRVIFYTLISVVIAVSNVSSQGSGFLSIIAPFLGSLVIGSIIAICIPIWIIRNADWIAKKIIKDDEPISFPDKWFHPNILLIAIFILGLYQIIEGLAGIANSIGNDMQYSNVKWYIKGIGPIIRTVLGLIFAVCPQIVLKIIRDLNIFGQPIASEDADKPQS